MDSNTFKRIYGEHKAVEFKDEDINIIKNIYKEMNFQEATQLCKLVDLSLKETILDVEELFITLKYCYSGYEYFSQFVDFNDIKNNIINELKELNENTINTNTLAKIIAKNISRYVNDGHFSFETKTTVFPTYKPYLAYVTGIIVEEYGNDYKVIKGNKKLPLETIISRTSLEAKLLPTLTTLSNKKCYLIGVYSNKKIETLEIDNIELKTHLIYADKYEENNPEYIYNFVEHKNYNLLYSKKYVIYENTKEYLKVFNEMGTKSKNKNVVIFDIAGNRGGWSAYPEEFIKGLNEYSYWKTDMAMIKNDIFGNKNNNKEYEILYADEYDTSKGTFDGTLYVVTNKTTASSGEAAIAYSHSCRNVVFVGSASAGAGLFGDIKSYLLPRSKIYVSIPFKVFFEGKEEGKGFLPDYWIDSKNPSRYLEKWLKHNHLI